MSDFLKMVDETSNELSMAGAGMVAIADLLIRDGIDHDLSEGTISGLHRAMVALGYLVKAAGGDLCEACEAEADDGRENQAAREVNHG